MLKNASLGIILPHQQKIRPSHVWEGLEQSDGLILQLFRAASLGIVS